VQSLKDRTEGFDDYYGCMKEEYELEHVSRWTWLSVFMYYAGRTHIKFTLLTHFIGADIRFSSYFTILLIDISVIKYDCNISPTHHTSALPSKSII
jgi:hypothetical protein